MIKRFAVSFIVAFIMFGAPAVAMATDGHGEDRGDDSDNGRHHGSAPEPITMIGLALGAGGIVAAGWASRRSSRKR
jgi:hypothetical protein